MLLELLEGVPYVLNAGGDDRVDELVLGLEVVVDVAERDLGGLSDIRQRRAVDSLGVEDPRAPSTRRSRFPTARSESVISLMVAPADSDMHSDKLAN